MILAYTYDADYHCVSCARLDHRLVTDEYGYVYGTDSEGNEIHPLFSTDEWYANDLYEGNDTATLGCSTCGGVIKEIDLS